MRRILLFAVILLIAAGGWFVLRGAGEMARRDITTQLEASGFKHVMIETLSTGPRRTQATNITLDRQNIDKVKSISLTRGWLPFSGKNADIIVEGPDIYRHVPHVSTLLPAVTGLSRDALAELPKGKIVIRDGRINVSSPLGDFQFLFNVIVDSPDENSRRAVTAIVRSTQTTLDFESNWGGWIEADGTMLIDTRLPEVKAQIGAFRLTRGNGWLSLSNVGVYPALTGQIESGAAVLGSLPLQEISMTLDIERASINVIARARASGTPHTILSVDAILDDKTQTIEFSLDAADPAAFFAYLEDALNRSADTLKKSFGGRENLFAAVTYQPAKRFASGPYPFDMRGILGGKEIASGTFLIYPDTFDMRGSAKIDQAYLKGVTEYFKIPKDVISGDYIRMDASLSSLFLGVGAGIVDDAGEGP